MKVLQVNCVWRTGSTGKIIADLHNELKLRGHESIICYGRSNHIIKEPNVYKISKELESKLHSAIARYVGGLAFGGMFFSTNKVKRLIEKEKPDIVHIHCINGSTVNVFELIKYLGRKNIKTVVTHHAEFFYTGNCGHAYNCDKFTRNPGCGSCPILKEATTSRFIDKSRTSWIKMRKAFGYHNPNNLIFTAVSPWVKERSLLSPITKEFKCETVMNGLDTSIFHQYDDYSNLKARLHKDNRKIVLYSSAYFNTDPTSLKGGHYVVELARRLPNVLFIVVALLNQYDSRSLPNNIYVWGRTKDQRELAQLYSMADVTVLTSRRETFSMVTAESLCCGTPVVGFMAGGPESIALTYCTEFVEYGNINALEASLKIFIEKNFDRRKIEKDAFNMYSKQVMTSNYIHVYKELLNL